MTAKRRLVPLTEVKEAMEFLRKEGLTIASVDIRSVRERGLTSGINAPPAAIR